MERYAKNRQRSMKNQSLRTYQDDLRKISKTLILGSRYKTENYDLLNTEQKCQPLQVSFGYKEEQGSRKVCRAKREQLTGEWRVLHCRLYSCPSTVRVYSWRRLLWARVSLFFMSMGWEDVSELRPLTGLLFSPQVIYCNVLGVLYSRWNFIALQKSIHYS
jgi:hypothetical protein